MAGVDALYISHLHPDHFDQAIIRHFRRDLPILLLDREPNYLQRMLAKMGFTDIRPLKDHEVAAIGPFRCTMFAPFAKHPFHHAEIGNIVDSALLVEGGGHAVLNTNDNMLTEDVAKQFAGRYPPLTVAMLGYNAAGPYPACFDNLDDTDKLSARDRIRERNFRHMAAVARILRPRFVMPFAGAYVLGGKNWVKNRFLATFGWDEAADYLAHHAPELRPLVLREGLTFDLGAERIVNGTYQRIDRRAQQDYIRTVIASKQYPHEQDPPDPGLRQWLEQALPDARANLWRVQQRMRCFPQCHCYIRLPTSQFHFDFASPASGFLPIDSRIALTEPYLSCSLDLALLGRILRRQSHWNNAEIGGHISFFRHPDTYQPDVHMLLSFFHLSSPPDAHNGTPGV